MSFRHSLKYLAAGLLLAATTGLAGAADVLSTGSEPFISELRGGVFYHEDSRLKRLFMNSDEAREGGVVDLNFEVLFARPHWRFGNPIVDFALRPRPHVGATVNLGGGTSDAYFGLVWDLYIFKKIFIEGSLDGAVHNGNTGMYSPGGRRELGCNPLFRQSISVGADITRNWRVMFTLEHLENFELCHENAGLSNLGIRFGYRF